MNVKRTGNMLDVYVGSSKIGLYTRAANGSTSFRYDPAWLADDEKSFPISLSMPLSDRIWSGVQVNGFFDGLLPDNQDVKNKIAAREQADSAATFDLLSVIGRDCVGALRFVPEGLDPGDPTKMRYRPVSDNEIAKRIASLGIAPLGIQDDDDFRISIAGIQEKTALLQIDNQWQLPLGATPTSHIFKPAMKAPPGVDFSDTPWNEWLCLALCDALGLESAKARVLIFDDKPVIVVERFDRIWQGGILYRLPQEDLCQALGVPPTQKYQSEGGPGIITVLDCLNGAATSHKDRLTFMQAQIVFWLLTAIDGHAKNFSILLTPGGYKLAPLYDVISVAPYAEYPEFSYHKSKLAMSVGKNNHYHIKNIHPRHFYQTAQQAGLRKQEMDDIFSRLAAQVDTAIAAVSALAIGANMPMSIAEPIFATVKERTAYF